jgi:hypothetical protein
MDRAAGVDLCQEQHIDRDRWRSNEVHNPEYQSLARIRAGDSLPAALTGGFHQTFWVLGAIALLAPLAVFAIVRGQSARRRRQSCSIGQRLAQARSSALR